MSGIISELRAAAVAGVSDWSEWGHITGRERGRLVILNYAALAAVEANWTPAERVCRGLVIDRDTGEIVARGFDKFFNWGEGGRVSSAPVEYVTEKADGSLGILYRADGYRVTTRGSFDSEQGAWATAWLAENHDLAGLDDDLTLLFEIVYPENRIVLDYGGWSGLILLGARNRHTGEHLPWSTVAALASSYGFTTPATHDVTDPDALQSLCRSLPASREGFVAALADGSRWKFKGDEYKALHRLITGLTPNRVLAAVAAGTVDEMFTVIPDEFLDDARAWVAEIEEERQRIWRVVEAALQSAPRGDRKSLALYIARHPDYAPVAAYVFASVDGGDVDALIYRRAFKTWRPVVRTTGRERAA